MHVFTFTEPHLVTDNELVRNIVRPRPIGRPRLGIEVRQKIAQRLFRDGHTVRQVADLLGVSRSKAGRLRLKAAAEGIIDAVGEDENEDLEAAVEGRFRLN
jgi:DNA-binding transcriptional regulator LsrR (DeoR family)